MSEFKAVCCSEDRVVWNLTCESHLWWNCERKFHGQEQTSRKFRCKILFRNRIPSEPPCIVEIQPCKLKVPHQLDNLLLLSLSLLIQTASPCFFIDLLFLLDAVYWECLGAWSLAYITNRISLGMPVLSFFMHRYFTLLDGFSVLHFYLILYVHVLFFLG